MTMSEAVTRMHTAYDACGTTWGDGPHRVYDELATRLVDYSDRHLAGLSAVDAGSGGGAVARALRAAGARVTAVDTCATLLRAGGHHAVVGDIGRLPVRSGAVDVATAGFVLSDLPDPGVGLAELARVVRPGGIVLTSSFATGPRLPENATIDEVADHYGYVAPDWYVTFKRELEPRVGDPDLLRMLALDAGLVDVSVCLRRVSLRLGAEQVVSWRLGMAHFAPWFAGLPALTRDIVLMAAWTALGGYLCTLRLPVLLMRGRVTPGG